MRHGWRLAEEAWQAARRAFNVHDWCHCSLTDTNRSLIPQSAGVYLLCARPLGTCALDTAPALYDAIYIGRSSNLRDRYSQHCRGYGDVRQARRAFGALDFYYALMPEVATAHVEAQLIDALGPAANKIQGRIYATVGTPQKATGRFQA